jgi:pimeloyl-ACP methyl ester carboxylesterase
MRRGVLLIIVALAVLATACGSSSKSSSSPTTTSSVPVAYTGSDDAFYVPPSPLPGKQHGDLIRYQKLPDIPNGHAYRVMYRSESTKGDPIAVTGLVAVPTTPGTDRVVLSWAHGTTGIADICAPSKNPSTAFNPLMGDFLTRGWDIVATDFEGLGTPGRHPYIAGVSEGRGTLDIIRAVHQVPDTSAGDRALLWGHSQGGHAVMFASQLAPTWTPEVKVLGTVAGAPPSELPLINAALKGGAFQGYLAMASAGLNAAYPEAKLEDVITPKALALLPVVDQECTDGVFKKFNAVSYDEFSKADPVTVPAWKKVLEDDDPGHVKLTMPLLIIHGLADEQIPPIASELMFKRLCSLGQIAERRTYPGMHHAEVIVPSFKDMVSWMDDRVAGKPATNGCPKT